MSKKSKDILLPKYILYYMTGALFLSVPMLLKFRIKNLIDEATVNGVLTKFNAQTIGELSALLDYKMAFYIFGSILIIKGFYDFFKEEDKTDNQKEKQNQSMRQTEVNNDSHNDNDNNSNNNTKEINNLMSQRTSKTILFYNEEKNKKDLTPLTPLATNNQDLNKMITIIKEKGQHLLSNPLIHIEQEILSKHTVEKCLQNYLPKLINTYNEIEPELRNIKLNEKTATELTKNQLKLILNGLEEVEFNLLTTSHNKLRVSQKILERAFNSNNLELEV